MILLQDTLETRKRNKPVYFGGMTGIGPMYTERLAEAERFESREQAMMHRAYRHPFCFFEPVELQDETSTTS